MIANINTRLLKRLTLEEKAYDVRDKQLKGFMIRVYPTGKMTCKCELRRMRRHRHIDFERQGLFLTLDITKAKKPRYIPLDDKIWKVLTDWLEQTKDQYAADSLVFTGKDGNTEFNNMTKSWERLLKVANIENFTWHDMRHDYASQLVMSGVDLNTVRELLGHADLKMTLRYAHLAPAHKKLAVQSLQNRRDEMLTNSKVNNEKVIMN